MEEILFELRDHCAGLNAGRWDYIFSIIKNYRGRGARFVLPDRSEVTMTVPFMRAYTELLVKTCHKRGAFAIGGMSAFIPNRRDPEVTAARVREGRRRQEARGRRRLRRHVGGAPRPDPDGAGGVRRGARRPAEPGRPAARRRRGDGIRSARRAHRPAGDRGGRARRTSRSRSATSRRGCAASARWRSTT